MNFAFDHKAPHIFWWNTWRDHIASAKQYPQLQNGYCYAASIANMEFNCYLAIEIFNFHKKQ